MRIKMQGFSKDKVKIVAWLLTAACLFNDIKEILLLEC